MKLVVVSHTAHYRRGDTWLGWGPTIRELDHLALLFDELVHVAPLHEGPPPQSSLEYKSSRIRIHPVPPSGGDRFKDKLQVLTQYPRYASAILREMADADVVHVRCPANISLLALTLLAVVRRPKRRWLKYAGNWQAYQGEPVSYQMQRWMLRHNVADGAVTVNGEWKDQPSHIHSFFNPSLTAKDRCAGEEAASGKNLDAPARLLFVGRVERAKGVGRALRVVQRLRSLGIQVQLDVVGDGPQRKDLQEEADLLGVSDVVRFHGWMRRSEIDNLYASAHFILFPSVASEGWPKALSEGMAFGAVPIASRISSIPYYLEKFDTGSAFDPHDVEAFLRAIQQYLSNPIRWKEHSRNGVKAARFFSYDYYLEAVRSILDLKVSAESILNDSHVYVDS